MRKWRTSSRISDRFVELIVALIASALFVVGACEREAGACVNATMSESAAVSKLKAAEGALGEGDVLTARALAHEVREVYAWRSLDEGYGRGFNDRATRIEAMSHVRDLDAGEADLERAVSLLDRRVTSLDEAKVPPDPALLADFGEALERDGKDERAYAVLQPLAEKDLIGSAYAYAAFARSAKWKGDDRWASLAQTRCLTMATNPSPCRGEYPRPPFLRGEPLHFALAALVFLALGAVRLVRKPRPWSGWAARGLGVATLAYGVAVFLLVNVRYEGVAALFALGVCALLGIVQQNLWIGAVEGGKVPGFAIRPLTWKEEEEPMSTLRFMGKFDKPAVLERIGDPTYRESAKPAVLFQLRRRRIKARWYMVAIALVLLCAGFALLLGVSRGPAVR